MVLTGFGSKKDLAIGFLPVACVDHVGSCHFQTFRRTPDELEDEEEVLDGDEGLDDASFGSLL